VIGGEKLQGQLAQLKKGTQILVGTPGRVLDLIRSKWLSLGWVETAVLDEADEMLEIGFLPDVSAILDRIPAERQTLLFSATFPPELLRVAARHMRNPIRVETAKGPSTVAKIRQHYLFLRDEERVPALERILRAGRENCFLVFCDSRLEVDRVWKQLRNPHYLVYPLHGGYEQAIRTKIMARFRTGDVRALVATDVAARGLDISHVDHVINFGVPRTLDRYLHRIGRTGRAGATGDAVTFVTPRRRREWEAMVRTGRLEVRGDEFAHTEVVRRSAGGGSRKEAHGRRDQGGGGQRGRGRHGEGHGERRRDDDRRPQGGTGGTGRQVHGSGDRRQHPPGAHHEQDRARGREHDSGGRGGHESGGFGRPDRDRHRDVGHGGQRDAGNRAHRGGQPKGEQRGGEGKGRRRRRRRRG
jgi:superfamily II DNA/RNA helicase